MENDFRHVPPFQGSAPIIELKPRGTLRFPWAKLSDAYSVLGTAATRNIHEPPSEEEEPDEGNASTFS